MSKTTQSLSPIVKVETLKETAGPEKTLNLLRSLTRLAFGVTVVAIDTLVDRSRLWEDTLASSEISTNNDITYTKSKPSDIVLLSSTQHSQGHQVLVGLTFDAERKLSGGLKTVQRIEHRLDRVISPSLSALRRQRVLKPFYTKFD
jgi:hypothetical protein